MALLGGGLRFARGVVKDNDTYTEAMRTCPLNVLKFRGRLDTYNGVDVHREVSGAYFPRFRSFFINEIKDVQRLGERGIRLVPLYPEDTHLKPDGDFFYTEDFHVGARLLLGRSQGQNNKAGNAVVVTDVDDSQLSYRTAGKRGAPPQETAPPAAAWDRQTLRAVGVMLFGAADPELKVRACRAADLEREQDALHRLPHGQEAGALVRKCIAEGGGEATWTEFLEKACGPPNEMRDMSVVAAFKKTDYNKDSLLSKKEVKDFYSTKYHPRVLTGEVSEEQAKEKFIADLFSMSRNAHITFAQFADYFSDVSVRTHDDDSFLFYLDRAFNLDYRNLTDIPFH